MSLKFMNGIWVLGELKINPGASEVAVRNISYMYVHVMYVAFVPRLLLKLKPKMSFLACRKH